MMFEGETIIVLQLQGANVVSVVIQDSVEREASSAQQLLQECLVTNVLVIWSVAI